MHRQDKIRCEWNLEKGDAHARVFLTRYGIEFVAEMRPNQLVPIRIAALLLGVSIMAAYNWMGSKPPRLNGISRGKMKMIRLAELYEFAKNNGYLEPEYDPDQDDDLLYRQP